jgi:glutamine cyclotransferase
VKKNIPILFLAILTATVFSKTPLEYEILGLIPHNTENFTQGLVIIGENIYESTGSTGGGSRVIIIDKKTGKEINSVKSDKIFGEGLAFDGSMLWQLSWWEEKALVYNVNSLKKISEVPYKGEGWGLTYIPNKRIFAMSNGSDGIVFRDQNFKELRKIQVKMNDKSIDKLNELEFWNEKILANRWHSDTVFVINTESGEVENFIDLTNLRKAENPSIKDGNVLNGIAAIDNETLLVTGKRWRKFYIIRIKYAQQ